MKKIEKAATFLSLVIRHNNQEMLKVAKLLGLLKDAKNQLLYTEGNYAGRRDNAIRHIESAVDDIRGFERNEFSHRFGR